MAKFNYLLLTVILTFPVLTPVQAKGVYQEPEAFLDEVFAGDVPDIGKLWIDADLKEEIVRILGHEPGYLRISYWMRQQRSAWILEEIGKSLPITVGIVVNDGEIELVRILVFRESRGWEVRYPFFTDQFISAGLSPSQSLNQEIDGISGATLSVNAVKKLASLALLYHQQVSR
jgi:hypothetical protein